LVQHAVSICSTDREEDEQRVKLPGADRVRIDEIKIRGYLLSKIHPVGRFKARVFAALGFDDNSVEGFVSELRRIAAEGEVAEAEDAEFGRKYTVPGVLAGPAGSAQVLTMDRRAGA
jgi:hypothetical protein